jgi:hypothetical protein
MKSMNDTEGRRGAWSVDRERGLGLRAVAVSAVAGMLVTAIFVACSSDDPPAVDPTGSCGELASRCHPYDKLSTIGHDCHELGHEGDDDACAPRKAECLAACPPIEGGASHPLDASTDGYVDPDAAPVEAGPDSGDICAPYCECLTDTCASQSGYPFSGVADCVSQCGPLSVEEKDCLPKWCEQAKTLSDKVHVCEHAWGKFGLDECDTL